MLSHREVELVGEVDAASVNALIRQLRYSIAGSLLAFRNFYGHGRFWGGLPYLQIGIYKQDGV